MGNRLGHVVPGIGYLVIGLWQLYNHIKLHCQYPKPYNPPFWFPFPMVRRLELYLIMSGSLTYIFTELFLGPSRHQPLDPADWSIPAGHLHNFEHVVIALSMFIYAAFAVLFDLPVRPRAGHTLSLLIAGHHFASEFLIFYLHSTDHSGLEWQYHFLLLIVIAVALITTLMGIGHPRSFAVCFTRSVSVLFHGMWFIVVGIMLYTPRFIPRGCHLEEDDGFFTVPCDDRTSLLRGKALVNLQFAWSLAAVVVFSGWLYLRMSEKFPEVPQYECLEKEAAHVDDLPWSSKKKHEEEKPGTLFLNVGSCFSSMDQEK